MTTAELIALAGVLIAAIGIGTKFLMARHERKLKEQDKALGEVLGTFKPLFIELERTHFFGLDPEREIWEFGFETVKRLADLCAHAVVIKSRVVPDNVRSDVKKLHTQVKAIRAFHDSWKEFRKDKGGNWREIQQCWPEIVSANATLEESKPIAEQCKESLSKFLAARAAA